MARTVDIPIIESFLPLLEPSRYKGIYGGRGGAKSHAFADLLIDDCLTHRGLRAVCIREYQVSLEQSVKRLLDDKITAYGLTREFRSLNTHIETPGDGIIIFNGMQSHTADSIKSLEGYHRAWVEEAQNLSERSLTLLRPTIREPGSELWFSWNPSSKNDPVDQLLRGVPPMPDAVVLRSSYMDNPFFPEVLRREMEWDKRRDPDKYAHVWLGEYEQHAESRVFKNWTIAEFDDPLDAVWHYGADWGYSVDPSTLVRCRPEGRKLYISHEAYRVGVEIDKLADLFDTVPGAREHVITADSARPETISYLQRHGFPHMRAAVKGPNSVKEGIIFLQNFDIIVHPRCEHTVIELTNYRYKVDKKTEQVILPFQLNDKENHIIDPLRYAVEELRQPVVDNWVVA